MTIFEKLKALVQLNRTVKELQMLEKLKGFAGKLDGFKSVLGLLAVVAYYACPQFGVHLPDIVLKLGSGLAGVGLGHKLEKATGLLSKGLDIAVKALDVAKKTEDKLNEKEEGEKK
jgi:hypothetical protein